MFSFFACALPQVFVGKSNTVEVYRSSMALLWVVVHLIASTVCQKTLTDSTASPYFSSVPKEQQLPPIQISGGPQKLNNAGVSNNKNFDGTDQTHARKDVFVGGLGFLLHTPLSKPILLDSTSKTAHSLFGKNVPDSLQRNFNSFEKEFSDVQNAKAKAASRFDDSKNFKYKIPMDDVTEISISDNSDRPRSDGDQYHDVRDYDYNEGSLADDDSSSYKYIKKNTLHDNTDSPTKTTFINPKPLQSSLWNGVFSRQRLGLQHPLGASAPLAESGNKHRNTEEMFRLFMNGKVFSNSTGEEQNLYQNHQIPAEETKFPINIRAYSSKRSENEKPSKPRLAKARLRNQQIKQKGTPEVTYPGSSVFRPPNTNLYPAYPVYEHPGIPNKFLGDSSGDTITSLLENIIDTEKESNALLDNIF